MSRWTAADDLRLAIRMGLKKGLKLVSGMRRALNDDEQNTVAGAIAEHLKLANYRVEKGPPLPAHGTPDFEAPGPLPHDAHPNTDGEKDWRANGDVSG